MTSALQPDESFRVRRDLGRPLVTMLNKHKDADGRGGEMVGSTATGAVRGWAGIQNKIAVPTCSVQEIHGEGRGVHPPVRMLHIPNYRMDFD